MPPMEAGEGEHNRYLILGAGADQEPITPRQDYLGIDAVTWFINKQSDFFHDRLASGTLEIKLADSEHYQVALGSFELAHGAKQAPVFDRAVLPDRCLSAGPIVLTASLTAVKKDTTLLTILKSASGASLDVVSSMVQTASLTGPYRLLESAGDQILQGVKKVLSDTADKREPLFDFTGLEASLQTDQVKGPTSYLLFHRGSKFNQAQLSIGSEGLLEIPLLNGSPIDDGAWLLLRLRRSREYLGNRPWEDEAKSLRVDLSSLVEDAASSNITSDEALKQLKPSSSGNQTIFDRFVQLRGIIKADGVISEKQALAKIGLLYKAIHDAAASIRTGDPAHFETSISDVKKSLLSGAPLSAETTQIFTSQAADVVKARAINFKPKTGVDWDAHVAHSLRNLQHLQKTIASF